MQPENQAPHTPPPHLFTQSKNKQAFTRIESLSDHQPNSPAPRFPPLQQIVFFRAPVKVEEAP